jgi:uncharacterized protein (UPF0332 family)
MTLPLQAELDRARRELAAARALIEAGFPEKAVSSAYYAAFHSALAALLALGETRSKHSGVVAAFGELVVRQGGFDPAVARTLRDLFEQRNNIDYGLEDATTDEAHMRLGDSERFVTEVERWIEAHGRLVGDHA